MDSYYSDVEYVNDSIPIKTTVAYVAAGMAEGLAEMYLDPTMAVIVGAFLAAYGISAMFLSVNTLLKAAEFVAVVITVLSVYNMLKAGDELGEVLNGDYSEKEKAELFGKAAVMMIISAVGMYGSVNLITQPEMLRSIVTESKEVIGENFSSIKSFVKLFSVNNVDSLLSYCGEFISSPAEAYLQEAAQGRNVRQLHELAKMVRQARKEVGRMLTQDELVAAVENWKETGSIKEAVQAVVDWVKWKGSSLISITKERLQHSVLGDFNSKGRLINGGHGQANIDYLGKNNILYNIVKTYENGVRVGIIKKDGRIGTIVPDNSKQP